MLPDNPYAWPAKSRSNEVCRFVDRLTAAVANGLSSTGCLTDGESCDLFKDLYQDLFPRAMRHDRGEYYTPDWLAAHVLDQVGYTGEPTQRLLDPSCGSGTFLLLCSGGCERRCERGEKKEETNEGLWVGD